MNVTVEQLFSIIGQQQVEIALLRAQLAQLQAEQPSQIPPLGPEQE